MKAQGLPFHLCKYNIRLFPASTNTNSSYSSSELIEEGKIFVQQVSLAVDRIGYWNLTINSKGPYGMVPVIGVTSFIIESSIFNSFAMEGILKDEQQARDLLVWNDGIGTLDGCDLRFKINQLGCLELLDSDDESENQIVPKQSSNNTSSNRSNIRIDNSTNTTITTNGVSETTNSNDSNERPQKRAKLYIELSAPIRQISPGSSLLRDGPNIRRLKSSSGSNLNSTTGRPQANSLSLLKKIEHNQNSILLDKLVPKQKIDEIKTNVEQWTIDDVKRFVDSIPGCSGYGDLFETQQICGKSLMYLDQRDLLDVINVKLGPAVKIYHAISLLK